MLTMPPYIYSFTYPLYVCRYLCLILFLSYILIYILLLRILTFFFLRTSILRFLPSFFSILLLSPFSLLSFLLLFQTSLHSYQSPFLLTSQIIQFLCHFWIHLCRLVPLFLFPFSLILSYSTLPLTPVNSISKGKRSDSTPIVCYFSPPSYFSSFYYILLNSSFTSFLFFFLLPFQHFFKIPSASFSSNFSI